MTYITHTPRGALVGGGQSNQQPMGVFQGQMSSDPDCWRLTFAFRPKQFQQFLAFHLSSSGWCFFACCRINNENNKNNNGFVPHIVTVADILIRL